MHIKEALNTAGSITALHQLAQLAEPKLSFLGGQYVVATGYEGWLTIDEIAARSMTVISQNLNFSEEERPHGRGLANRVNYIYDRGAEQISHANLFTKILAIIGVVA